MKNIFLEENIKIHTMRMVLYALGFTSLFASKAFAQDVSSLPPLDELGTGKYQGYTGGLYPDGSNQMPPAFYNDAIEFAKSIQPLDADGKPDADGKIGLVTIGASTVAMFSEGLQSQIYNVAGLNKEIVFVNGGVGGQDLNKIYDQAAKYWVAVEGRVKSAGLTNEQVQIVWFQEDDLRDQSSAFPDRAENLADAFTYAIQKLKVRYPNLKFVYLTARHTTLWMPADAKDKHREPRAYLNGWATKFIIERQINGDAELAYKGDKVKAPMIIWGPYFWTQGDKARKDGYNFSKDLVTGDGIHPNEAGKIKVAKDILDFWKNDAVSQLWFLENPGAVTASTDVTVVNTTGTENMVSYMRLYILGNEIEKIDRSMMTDKIRILLLKDTVVVSNEEYFVTDSLNIHDLDPGQYTYLIKDQEDFLTASKFFISPTFTVSKGTGENATSISTANDSEESSTTKQKNIVGEDEPAWFVNGINKLPKLKRLLGSAAIAKAVITSRDGEVVLEVEDVLTKHTDLNEKLESGQYNVKFYDEKGDIINAEMPQNINIK